MRDHDLEKGVGWPCNTLLAHVHSKSIEYCEVFIIPRSSWIPWSPGPLFIPAQETMFHHICQHNGACLSDHLYNKELYNNYMSLPIVVTCYSHEHINRISYVTECVPLEIFSVCF